MSQDNRMNALFSDARACAENYFHDCDFIDVADHRTGRLHQKSITVVGMISGTKITLKVSRTNRVAMRDKFTCRECKLTAKSYFMVMRNKATGGLVGSFIGFKDGRFIPMTKDHIVAKFHGGGDAFKNLQCMCYECNQDKAHDKIIQNKSIDPTAVVTIPTKEYEELQTRRQDFAAARNNIKRVINRLPWYLKLIGIDSLIERRIKHPIERRGYYGNNLDESEK